MSQSQWFRYHGHAYEMLTLDRVSVRDQFAIDRALVTAGTEVRYGDLLEAIYQQDDMIKRVRKGEPGADDELRKFGLSMTGQTLTSVATWISLRAGGLDISPDDVLSITPSEVDFIDSPEDHAGKAQPQAFPTGSARAGGGAKRKRK